MKKTPKPKWIRAKLPTKREFGEIKSILRDQNLHTVCEEAFCPNRPECWESRTATFLLMGSYCTRRCKFCDVETRNPHQYLSSSEPENLADAVRKLGLKYVVLTSVTRDDLADGGAEHLSSCIRNVRQKNPGVLIEILIPDFRGNMDSLKKLVDCKPEVIGHNIETTEDLTPIVRDKKSSFKQSIDVLKNIKQLNSRILTKSSMMLGLGETDAQVLAALHHLKRVKVDIVTLGQYLQPSRKHLEVVEYLDPQKFEYWDGVAQQIGFLYVASGPLVRSSYRAGEMYVQNFLKNN